MNINSDGLIVRLKARLVAKRYAQTCCVDYFDTFFAIAKITSIRLFKSLVAAHDWDLH